jgi:hypothetical protein
MMMVTIMMMMVTIMMILMMMVIVMMIMVMIMMMMMRVMRFNEINYNENCYKFHTPYVSAKNTEVKINEKEINAQPELDEITKQIYIYIYIYIYMHTYKNSNLSSSVRRRESECIVPLPLLEEGEECFSSPFLCCDLIPLKGSASGTVPSETPIRMSGKAINSSISVTASSRRPC